MLFLRIIKVLAIICGVIALPLIIFGWGIFISVPLFVFAYAIDRKTDPRPGQTNKKLITNIIVVLAGLACLFGLYIFGAIGHIDTTGKPDTPFMIISFVIVAAITASLLRLVNKRSV